MTNGPADQLAVTSASDGSIYLANVENLAGGTTLVTKFDGSGAVKWRAHVPGIQNLGGQPMIATTGLGNVFVASLGYLTKLDASGAVTWQQVITPEPTGLAVDSQGGVAVSSPGAFDCMYERCPTGRITQYRWDGVVEWEKDNGTVSDYQAWLGIARTSGDALYALDGRGHLLKLSSAGTQLWSHTLTSSERPNQVVALSSGDAVVLTGSSAVRITADGVNESWSYPAANGSFWAAAAGPQDSILLSRNFPEGGCASITVDEVRGNGTAIASRTFHHVVCESIPAVRSAPAFTPSGAPLLAGWFNGTVDFGTGPKTASNGTEIFLLQLAP